MRRGGAVAVAEAARRGLDDARALAARAEERGALAGGRRARHGLRAGAGDASAVFDDPAGVWMLVLVMKVKGQGEGGYPRMALALNWRRARRLLWLSS